jgi:hypothetical protein
VKTLRDCHRRQVRRNLFFYLIHQRDCRRVLQWKLSSRQRTNFKIRLALFDPPNCAYYADGASGCLRKMHNKDPLGVSESIRVVQLPCGTARRSTGTLRRFPSSRPETPTGLRTGVAATAEVSWWYKDPVTALPEDWRDGRIRLERAVPWSRNG